MLKFIFKKIFKKQKKKDVIEETYNSEASEEEEETLVTEEEKQEQSIEQEIKKKHHWRKQFSQFIDRYHYLPEHHNPILSEFMFVEKEEKAEELDMLSHAAMEFSSEKSAKIFEELYLGVESLLAKFMDVEHIKEELGEMMNMNLATNPIAAYTTSTCEIPALNREIIEHAEVAVIPEKVIEEIQHEVVGHYCCIVPNNN